MVGRLLWRAGNGREALLVGQKWSGGSSGGPAVVGKASGRVGSDRESITEVRVWSGAITEGWEC